MFKLKKSNIVWWPVTINEPADGGLTTEHKCQIQFELVSQDKFDELAEQGDSILLTTLVKGWRELLDENDGELAFNQENINALLQYPYVRAGFIRAYMGAISGTATTDSALIKN